MAPQVVAAPPQPPGSGAPKGLLGRLATRLGGGAAGAGGQEAPSRPWVTLGLVAAMFATSISLVIYNKWLFSAPPRGHGFPFPIAVTCIHMSCAATAVCWVLGLPRLSLGELVKGARGGGGGSGAELRKMLRVVVPIAFFIGTDIALTNTSFMYLDSSFIEMVKPSSNILVYVISVFMGLRGLNGWVIATVLLMMLGQVLIDFNATAFDMKGFVIVLMASTMSACRNVLVECMMQGHSLDRKMNSLELMTNVMPIAGAILFFSAFIPYKSRGRVCDEYPFLCPEEGDKAFLSEMELLSGMGGRSVSFLGVIIIGASLAFVLNLLEFVLLGRLSAMTMQSAGLVKLIFLFIATTTAFNEVISGRQVVGVLLGALGVALYNLFDHWERKQQTPRGGVVELMAMVRGARAYAKVEEDEEEGAKR